MDVLYYWKNFDSDLKARRIGYFKSEARKLQAMHDGYPDYIWVFNTPKGRKGEVQILGRLSWLDKVSAGIKPTPGQPNIFYDFKADRSVQFVDGGSDAAISVASDWVARHFPAMLAANFHGTTGQEELRGVALKELESIAGGLKRAPFRDMVA